MSSKFREGFKKIFQKVTCKNTNNRASSGAEFECSSAMKIHSRRSVTKDSSFEVLSNTVNDNAEDIVLQGDEPKRKSFSRRGGERKNLGNQNEKGEDSTPNKDNVKAESILLIEEKQYRLIKAKGHFNI